MMKKCRVTITTSVDGQENTITRDGEMAFSANGIQRIYREPNAATRICLQGENATVERIGDYTMRLQLTCGELTDGELGIGGSSGAIQTLTHRVNYSTSEQSLLLSLHYDLLISGETQKMQIRLMSRFV